MIEQYIKKREALAEQEADEQRFAEGGELTDEELQEYRDNIEEQLKLDNEESGGDEE